MTGTSAAEIHPSGPARPARPAACPAACPAARATGAGARPKGVTPGRRISVPAAQIDPPGLLWIRAGGRGGYAVP
ncbi:hypothetical protein GCM10010521_61060 [Streptomyces rameus]|uniref:Uncharacterized protein n=1 Tax=Streptomyces rameus TaxID=68261 RepID=A0ABN3V194_9ACTN